MGQRRVKLCGELEINQVRVGLLISNQFPRVHVIFFVMIQKFKLILDQNELILWKSFMNTGQWVYSVA